MRLSRRDFQGKCLMPCRLLQGSRIFFSQSRVSMPPNSPAACITHLLPLISSISVWKIFFISLFFFPLASCEVVRDEPFALPLVPELSCGCVDWEPLAVSDSLQWNVFHFSFFSFRFFPFYLALVKTKTNPECPLVARLGWPSWLKLFSREQRVGWKL